MTGPPLTLIYLGIGSNLGDRMSNLGRAVGELRDAGLDVRRCSSVYETEPVGPPQPDFLNAVVEIGSALDPQSVLKVLKSIESKLGRTDGERWGPRTIDLDLLLYGDSEVKEEGLIVPHPELTRRRFVLAPLLEVSPEIRLPSGRKLESLLKQTTGAVHRIAPPEAICDRDSA